jgi:hypothetical protein
VDSFIFLLNLYVYHKSCRILDPHDNISFLCPKNTELKSSKHHIRLRSNVVTFSRMASLLRIPVITLDDRLTVLAPIWHHQLSNQITSFVVTPAFSILLRWRYIHYTFTISITDYISLITYLTFRELLARLIMLLARIRTIKFHVPWLLSTNLPINF